MRQQTTPSSVTATAAQVAAETVVQAADLATAATVDLTATTAALAAVLQPSLAPLGRLSAFRVTPPQL